MQNDKIKIKIFKEITKVLKDIESTEYLNLDSLVKLNHPASIPYIIIRNADWVTSINIKAKSRLNEMISKKNFNDILLYISLINKMKKLLRFNYEEIINKIDSLYRISDFSREFKESIQSKDEYLREYTKINLINYYNKDFTK